MQESVWESGVKEVTGSWRRTSPVKFQGLEGPAGAQGHHVILVSDPSDHRQVEYIRLERPDARTPALVDPYAPSRRVERQMLNIGHAIQQRNVHKHVLDGDGPHAQHLERDLLLLLALLLLHDDAG